MVSVKLRASLAIALILVPRPPAARQTLPLPTGLFPVGTTTWQWSVGVAGRGDLPRAAQLYYPAAPGEGERARYLPDSGLVEAMVQTGYYRQTPEWLRSWSRLTTSALVGATPAVTRRAHPFPLLVVFPGLGVSRTQYTTLAQELASHGYVVVTIDPTVGGMVVGPDGRRIPDSTEIDFDSPGSIDAVARQWAGEAKGLLDLLFSLPDSSRLGRVIATVDPEAIGAIGHSLGGAAAWTACGSYRRFHACAGLDGTVTEALVEEVGFARPTLVLESQPVYSDADLAAAGRTREEWEHGGSDHERRWGATEAGARGTLHRFGVRGFGHMSFSDAPFVMPDAITWFGGRTVGAGRGLEIMSALVRTFFDRYVRDYVDAPLDAVADGFPEVERRPVGSRLR